MGGWNMGEIASIEQRRRWRRRRWCIAAVDRSERRLQSLLMGEIRLCYQSSEELDPKHSLNGPLHRGNISFYW